MFNPTNSFKSKPSLLNNLATIMAALALCLVVFLAMTGYSSAAYCICNPGLSDSVLQKNIDYACGSGVNCGPILQTGTCYNPNTVKDHCNYAVNNYFQNQGEAPGSCNFTGTAQVSQTPPSGAASQCYPSSPSTSTPGTTTPGTTTPGTTTTPPSTTPGNTTPTGTNTPSTTSPGITLTPTPTFGTLGPSTGNGIDNSSSMTVHQNFYSFTLILLLSGLMWLRVVA